MKNKIFFRVSSKHNPAVTHNLKAGPATFAAAPFDTPSHVFISTDDDGMLIAEFHYALGDDEPRTTESRPNGILMSFGQVSGRVMRMEAPKERIHAAAEELIERQRQILESLNSNQPLRKVAHYGLVGTRLLPEIDSMIEEQLPDLRRITNH